MSPIIRFLFVCLLLSLDWAGDPYNGQSPLSRPMSSQIAYCHAIHHRAVLCKTWSWERAIAIAFFDTCPVATPCVSWVIGKAASPPLALTTDLTYLLMTIQR
jgi:hypothetical protein